MSEKLRERIEQVAENLERTEAELACGDTIQVDVKWIRAAANGTLMRTCAAEIRAALAEPVASEKVREMLEKVLPVLHWVNCHGTRCDEEIALVEAALAKREAAPHQGPCSACGDGDTAMEYHTHERVAEREAEGAREPQFSGKELQDMLERVVCGPASAIEVEILHKALAGVPRKGE